MFSGLIPSINIRSLVQNKQQPYRQPNKRSEGLFNFGQTNKQQQGAEELYIPYELYAISKLLKYSLGDDVTVEEYIQREDNSSTFKIYKGLECIGLYNPNYEHKKLQLFNPEKYKKIFEQLTV